MMIHSRNIAISHWTVLHVFVLAYMKDITWKKQLCVFVLGSILYAAVWWLLLSLIRKLNIPEKCKKWLFQ